MLHGHETFDQYVWIQKKRCSHYLTKTVLFVEITSTHRAWPNELTSCENLLITLPTLFRAAWPLACPDKVDSLIELKVNFTELT